MAIKVVPKDEMVKAIGTKFEPGPWITVDQQRINTFADCTEDHQFIHVDQEAAKNTPFGGTIAHGFLSLSLLSKMAEGNGIVPENIVMGLNYGFDKVRFLAPVKSGKRIRANADNRGRHPQGRQPVSDQAVHLRGNRGRGDARPGRGMADHGGHGLIDAADFIYSTLEELTMAIRYDGKVAIVTGAGGGLGRSHAIELAKRGAKVVINDLGGGVDGSGGSSAAAKAVVAEIEALGGEAIANGANVAKYDEVEAMVKQAMDKWGRVDILVNNAGILRDKSFTKGSLEDFQLVLDVHLMGSVHCTKACWEIMREQAYGRIVVTTSSSGLYGNFGQTNYGSAKMGVIGMMNTLSQEGAKYNIRVNALAPTAGYAHDRGPDSRGGVRPADTRNGHARRAVPGERGCAQQDHHLRRRGRLRGGQDRRDRRRVAAARGADTGRYRRPLGCDHVTGRREATTGRFRTDGENDGQGDGRPGPQQIVRISGTQGAISGENGHERSSNCSHGPHPDRQGLSRRLQQPRRRHPGRRLGDAKPSSAPASIRPASRT